MMFQCALRIEKQIFKTILSIFKILIENVFMMILKEIIAMKKMESVEPFI
jgi:hypothetical protein